VLTRGEWESILTENSMRRREKSDVCFKKMAMSRRAARSKIEKGSQKGEILATPEQAHA